MSLRLVALWLHLIGAFAWIGGLLYQAHVLAPAARRGEGATFMEAARRGRPVTWVAIGVVAATGLYNVTRIGPLEHVMASGAATALAAKLGLVIVAVALAAQRDFAQVPALRAALASGADPRPALRAIAWLDRLVLLLAAIVVYLGLVVSRA